MKKVGGNWLPDHEKHLIEWMATKKNEFIVDGRQIYQHRKQEAAFAHVTGFRNAIDVGAHVGLWSWPMTARFQRVYAFEPSAEHRECYLLNVPGSKLVELAPPPEAKPESAREGADEDDGDGEERTLNEFLHGDPEAPPIPDEITVANDPNADEAKALLFPIALGNKEDIVSLWTEPGSSGNTRVVPLREDPVEMRTLDSFGFDDIDFIKVDCEGYELYVLEGAVETLKRNKPVVIVEQKPHVIKNFGFKGPEACRFLESLGMKQLREISGDFVYGW